jgi:hypothetical protein
MSILRLDTAKSEKFICGMFFIFTQLNYCYFASETIDFISFFQHLTLQNSQEVNGFGQSPIEKIKIRLFEAQLFIS